MSMADNDTLTAVDGVRVGHSTDREAMTGLTVILFPRGAVASCSVRGAAPGTREVALLRPGNTVDEINAILLTGGSAYGLDAAAGVMRYLGERAMGFAAGKSVVPIVPAAVLFDLEVGDAVAPDARAGYRACEAATTAPVPQGAVGVGTGCTVGKILGMSRASRGGVGSSVVRLSGGGVVGALAAVNAMGNVVDGEGTTLAGVRDASGSGFLSAAELIINGRGSGGPAGCSTTLVTVVTDVSLDKTGCRRLAEMAHDGLAISIRPCHTSLDGDTVFAASTRRCPGDLDRVGVAAVRAVSCAVRSAVAGGPG